MKLQVKTREIVQDTMIELKVQSIGSQHKEPSVWIPILNRHGFHFRDSIHAICHNKRMSFRHNLLSQINLNPTFPKDSRILPGIVTIVTNGPEITSSPEQ